jgi:type I restriction enzyme S subunit
LNLENGKIIIKEDTKQVDVTEYNRHKINLEGNTLLLSINGTIGKNAFYNGEKIVLGKSACYLSVTLELKKEYLRYFLLSDFFFKYVQKNSRQATIKNLGLKEIRMMPIPIPPLQEQQSIVSFLDSLNEKVNTLQQNYSHICDECDALKQSILRQVFE